MPPGPGVVLTRGQAASGAQTVGPAPIPNVFYAADRASDGTRHGAFRAVRTHARQGPHQLRDDLNRFTFLLGGGGGERLFGP